MMGRFSDQPLSRRIVAAMIVMTAVVGTAYCFAVWYGISLAEELLIGRSLESSLTETVAPKSDARFQPPVIYAEGAAAAGYPPIPEKYRDFKDGFTEVVGVDDRFVFKKTVNGTTWLIEQDQYGFEDREMGMYAQALIGLAAALLAAALVGLWLSATVTGPVKKLSAAVRRMAEDTAFRPINEPFADDEIGQLARTVESTLKRIHETLDREKAFTADVSHELRTPLTVISTTAELLTLPSTEAEKNARIAKIRAASTRINRLIRVFLALARGRADSTEVIEEDLAAVAKDVCANWTDAVKKKGLTLTLENKMTKPVSVNSAFAESLLDNLVRNAVQYTQKGGVTVRLEDTGFSVTDTGLGIRDEDRERLMQAFVRGHLAPGEGYGWGLSLVRRICAFLQWKFELHSTPGKGSTFRVRFS